jgi:hypothetical protein
MRYVKGDPYWLTTRYPGACSCGAAIDRGERAFYWPKGKKLECAACGEASERRFLVETADEVWS